MSLADVDPEDPDDEEAAGACAALVDVGVGEGECVEVVAGNSAGAFVLVLLGASLVVGVAWTTGVDEVEWTWVDTEDEVFTVCMDLELGSAVSDDFDNEMEGEDPAAATGERLIADAEDGDADTIGTEGIVVV